MLGRAPDGIRFSDKIETVPAGNIARQVIKAKPFLAINRADGVAVERGSSGPGRRAAKCIPDRTKHHTVSPRPQYFHRSDEHRVGDEGVRQGESGRTRGAYKKRT